MLLQGRGGGSEEHLSTVSLPDTLEPTSISLLLDFMYTSRLPLTPSVVPGVLSAATYLQMDHVADTCREFMQLHWWGNLFCIIREMLLRSHHGSDKSGVFWGGGLFCFFSREKISVRHPPLELDSAVLLAPVDPKRVDPAYTGSKRFLTKAIAARSGSCLERH